MARWLEELQDFNFTVVHRAGACHAKADAISHHPYTAAGCRDSEAVRREGEGANTAGQHSTALLQNAAGGGCV